MRVPQVILAICLHLAGLGIITSSAEEPQGPKSIDAFSLPVWGSSEHFSLDDEPDAIIVLDFFAYWCRPCLQASRDLEQSVDRYYESRQGNRNGLPVKVLSINIEQNFPAKTDAFIASSGARFVLNAPEGSLLEKLGGKALPFFAILKKSDFENSTGEWNVLYSKSGYEGAETFRSVIDSVEGSTDLKTVDPEYTLHPPTPSIEAELQHPEKTYASDTAQYTINSEVLDSSDISIQTIRILRAYSQDRWEHDLALSYGRISVDYEPFTDADILGKSARLIESNASLQATSRFSRSAFLEYQISAGGYYGYSSHRSLWLDEYYRQQFSGLIGYEFANPWGVNVSGGAQWDTQSRFGIVGATIAAQQDDVAPGYDRPLFQTLDRGRERLHSGSLLLSQESIISKTARMRNQVSVTGTTDRELRYQYTGYLNFVLSESWVLRTEGATTFEKTEAEGESDFYSFSGGFTLERDWNQRLFLSLTGRRYRDNGQIETSILVSSGPPPLETTHIGATLRWQGEKNAYRLSLASYQSRFDEVDSPIRPFGNLYTNRDWLLATVSLNRSF